MASKLKETDVRNSSFAVGVESGWGTGKTTFLSYIREALPADSIVMEFNPWLSLSDRSLVTAYYNSLANVVSENLDKDLFSPIQKYGTEIWNKFYDHYRRKSLLFQFAKHRTADLSTEQFKRFITGLLRLWSRDARNEKNVQAILVQILDKEYTPQIVESDI